MACIARRKGRWIVDFRDHLGRRHWESYRTREEAKRALEERLRQLRVGTYRPRYELPTFAELVERFLAAKQGSVRPQTLANYEQRLSLPLERLGRLRVDRITPALVDQTLRREPLENGQLSPKMINAILGLTTAVFEFGLRYELVERNPAKLVERVRSGSPRTQMGREVDPNDVPTPEEVRELLLAAEPGLQRTFLLTSALTGARCGELLALRWQDVDFEAGRIHIQRNVSWERTRKEKERGEYGPRFLEPKTRHSKRSVEMPRQLALELKRWRLQAPHSELVFPKSDGTAMHRKTLLEKVLRPAQRRAGLRPFSLHSLRHFFASQLIAQGYPVTEVAARLGHSSPHVTLSVYAKWFRGAKSDAVERLAETLVDSTGR